MSEEEKMPYLIENKERDTFTFYVKGTKPYLDLQQRIDKAIEKLEEIELYDEYITIHTDFIYNLKNILGDKENDN